MTDRVAGPEGRVFPDLSAFLRTPFGAQTARVGVVALASAATALTICALLPKPANSSAPTVIRQADRTSVTTTRADGQVEEQVGAGIDVAAVWDEEQALLEAAANPSPREARANDWAPVGGVATLLATRFPSSSDVRTDDPDAGNLRTAKAEPTVPLPPTSPIMRLASVSNQAVARKKSPAQPAPQVASLPPQKSEPGYFNFFRKLFGNPDQAAQALLAANPKAAIYDIEHHVVYLPNGDKLEAHSGYGRWLDDPGSFERKNRGVTPPNVYTVTFREKLFHGVRALRLTPVGNSKMYGRDGMLAHTYMLGQTGQSNGCVSVKDYHKFLRAYEAGAFKQLIVVRSVEDAPPSQMASAQPGNV
jgi:hypothetical protein